LIEPAVGEVEEGGTAEVEAVVGEVEEGGTAEVEAVVGEVEEGGTAEVEAVVGDAEKTDTAPAGPHDDDTIETTAVLAGFRGRGYPRPQLPEQQVVEPVLVETPAGKGRLRSLALVASALAALLIGALFFGASRDGNVTAQSVPTVTATATATVSKPTSEPSDETADSGGEEPTIQLEDLADSAKPFEAVRIQGAYRGGTGTFLRVQRWDRGKWLDFPVPTKTDQAGQFITQAEFGQPGRYRLRVVDPDSGVTSKPFVVVIKG
jgi:pyruvate/2-oxoglutarate dehydrogenase complex dihydrolipoamide acyltransferase (E2) component